jgi:hypothetical protein
MLASVWWTWGGWCCRSSNVKETAFRFHRLGFFESNTAISSPVFTSRKTHYFPCIFYILYFITKNDTWPKSAQLTSHPNFCFGLPQITQTPHAKPLARGRRRCRHREKPPWDVRDLRVSSKPRICCHQSKAATSTSRSCSGDFETLPTHSSL